MTARKTHHRGRAGLRVEGADFFCGGGGASAGVVGAGIELRFAANHDGIAIATHSANHPGTDHFQVDLLEYDIAKLPAVRLAHFSPSCKFHSQANAYKVYEQPRTLFDYIAGTDGEEETRSGYANSERSRVTMSCVLRYAAAHHPELMVVENVVEAAKWGPARDGTTFQWWLGELDKLGYETKPKFLCSALFGVPQVRDRMYVVCWRKGNRPPDLDHHTTGWCGRCDAVVEARQTFREPTKAWPMQEWGKLNNQYDYRCLACRRPVLLALPAVAPVIEWNDLGIRIGDRADAGLDPLADSTIQRIERGLDKFGGSPPFVTLTRAIRYGGLERGVDGPCLTMTTRDEHALVNGAMIPFRQHTVPTTLDEPTFTATADQVAGLALQVTVHGHTHERAGSTCRTRSADEPSWALHTSEAFGLAFKASAAARGDRVSGMFAKINGGADDTMFHDPNADPANTITAKDTTALVSWLHDYNGDPSRLDGPAPTQTTITGDALVSAPERVKVEDLHFRMLQVPEIRRIMAYPENFIFASPDGREPSKRDKVRLLGDGVTPPVLTWLTERCLASIA